MLDELSLANQNVAARRSSVSPAKKRLTRRFVFCILNDSKIVGLLS